MTLTLADVVNAKNRIAEGIYESPCPESIPLSEICGAHVYCKLDYLQRTGSFKERGARNALLLLDERQHRQGVISASAGNHALGLAYHGKLLSIAVTVVMPRFAPLVKMSTCRRLGAEVVLFGESFSEAFAHAHELSRERGLTYIHGFDDPAIIAGQGTIGLEILEQVPDVEAIVVPIGGGGLIAGVSLAVKSVMPQVRVYGVEAARAAAFTAALAAGKPVRVPVQPTLADGLAVAEVGALAFSTAAPRVDRTVTVSEESLALAMLRLVELEKSVVEGAGAAPLAACHQRPTSRAGRQTSGADPLRRKRRSVGTWRGSSTRVVSPTVACAALRRWSAIGPADWPGWRSSSRMPAGVSRRSFTTARFPAPIWRPPTYCAPSKLKTGTTSSGSIASCRKPACAFCPSGPLS